MILGFYDVGVLGIYDVRLDFWFLLFGELKISEVQGFWCSRVVENPKP